MKSKAIVHVSLCRYSGTVKAIWSQNSGIWSTTCWGPSCCCVYVPTSTSMMSGKRQQEGRTREEHGLDGQKHSEGLQEERKNKLITLTWLRILGVPVGGNCQTRHCCMLPWCQCKSPEETHSWRTNRCVYMHIFDFHCSFNCEGATRRDNSLGL